MRTINALNYFIFNSVTPHVADQLEFEFSLGYFEQN